MFPGTQYHSHSLSMAPGDRLLLYSDGITEAGTQTGEPFGPERVAEQLRHHHSHSPVDFVRRFTTEVKRHCGTDLRDDATAVCSTGGERHSVPARAANTLIAGTPRTGVEPHANQRDAFCVKSGRAPGSSSVPA